MKKAKLNLVIDAVLMLCIAAIAGIGLLIKFVLVPGYRRWQIYGRNVNLSFWGLDRHQWGTIHLVIGCVFLALLVLHIILHWEVIVGLSCKPNHLLRLIVVIILMCLSIFLVIFPYFVKPDVWEQGQGQNRRGGETMFAVNDQSGLRVYETISSEW